MDIKKLNIPTLNGPNWGIYIISLQASARILNIWEAMRGEILPTTPPTYNLLVKTSPVAANATGSEITAYTAKSWSHAGKHLSSHMARLLALRHHKRIAGCLRECLRSCGGSINLPPIDQHGENPIHQFDGSVTSDPSFPRQLQSDNIEWP